MAEKTKSKKCVLGVMSGTSLDGLDLALCEFEQNSNNYSFKILNSKTVPYTEKWKKKLSEIKNASAEDYFKLHALYGKFIAEHVTIFIKSQQNPPNAIASHGHTVFHQPSLGFSTQLGCGATIAADTGLTTICDFRSLDVAMGGQGAPLVPIGDQLLFGNYEACLNIGGIANISYDEPKGKRIAYDICEANILLNFLAEKAGHDFDKGGGLARKGKIEEDLLHNLNRLGYYTHQGAKSIGREWFEDQVLDKINKSKGSSSDLLATATEHIATIISRELNLKKIKTVLVTGGGVFNTFLIEKIRIKTACTLVIPNEEIINFKEALIFAFLGYLRLEDKTNTLRTVTGARLDSIGGAVYLM